MLPYQLVEQAEFEKVFYPLATDGDGWEYSCTDHLRCLEVEYLCGAHSHDRDRCRCCHIGHC